MTYKYLIYTMFTLIYRYIEIERERSEIEIEIETR